MRLHHAFAFALVLLAVACSKSSKDAAPASVAASAAATAAPNQAEAKTDESPKAAGGKAKEKSEGDDKTKGKDAPKTWKRAGSATHAARIAIGDKETLPLRGMQVKVDVDGFRARVVLDAWFENDRPSQYEGTFQLRLPDDATPYFFAFGETQWEKPAPDFQKAAYIPASEQKKLGTAPDAIMAARATGWQRPKEARMVPKEKAAFAYTETTRRQADPALLEWAGAGVFNARVFPIAAHKVHRVVLAYDVDLVRAGTDLEYRLELPENVPVTVDVSTAGKPAVEPAIAGVTDGPRTYAHVDDPKDRAFTFRFPKVGNPLVVGGQRFAADAVVDLPASQAGSQERAVFLVDTSLSSNPDRFNVFLDLLRATLTNNRATLKRFAVLFFDVETTWWKNDWVDNTKENVDALLAEANNLTLEGATDVGAALAAAAHPIWAAKDAGGWDTFLLSDGAATWGESDRNVMANALTSAKRGPLFAYATGLAGTDSVALAHLARETGGAVFSVVGAAEVDKASTAHKLRPYRIVSVKADGAEDLLVGGRPRFVYPGQALRIVGRGAPKEIALTVEQGGKETTTKLRLGPAIESPMAARAYGQVATRALEEMGKATELVSRAYCIHHRVVSETCSLVMLESEADYARFAIKPERESERVQESPAAATIERAERQLEGSLADPKAYVQRWLEGLKDKPGVKITLAPDFTEAVGAMPRASFVVSPRPLEIKARTKDTLSGDLREKLTMPGSLEYEPLGRETEARRAKYGAGDALRALSSLVEQSPGDGILARDVGFTAMELGLGDHAFFLFRRVADARPWEPQSYKAMADVLGKMGMADLAIVYYEVSLQGAWDGRFGEFHRIAAVDYVRFLRRVEKGELKTSVGDFAKKRLAAISEEVALKGADLVVVITWNTDSSDVDLHVTEPSGEECFFSNRKTKLGGELTHDVTQGYGPEMYVMKEAKKGAYKVRAHYFAQQRNRASARTKVYAEVIERWGTPEEKVTEKTVTLAEGKEMHDIIDLKR